MLVLELFQPIRASLAAATGWRIIACLLAGPPNDIRVMENIISQGQMRFGASIFRSRILRFVVLAASFVLPLIHSHTQACLGGGAFNKMKILVRMNSKTLCHATDFPFVTLAAAVLSSKAAGSTEFCSFLNILRKLYTCCSCAHNKVFDDSWD